MNPRQTLAAVCAIFAFTTPAVAKEMTFAGIEVSETSCDEAAHILEGSGSLSSVTINSITNDTMYILKRGALGRDFVLGGAMSCENGKVVSIRLTIPKNMANEIADVLDRSYRRVSRNLPRLGNGEAVYGASKSTGTISYIHVSFEAEVEFATDAFLIKRINKQVEAYVAEQEKLKNSF